MCVYGERDTYDNIGSTVKYTFAKQLDEFLGLIWYIPSEKSHQNVSVSRFNVCVYLISDIVSHTEVNMDTNLPIMKNLLMDTFIEIMPCDAYCEFSVKTIHKK